MNYLKCYVNIIRKSQTRQQPDCYTEKHHVFPVSIYGPNKLICHLTAKEHYIVHQLLYKGFSKRYGDSHFKTIKMARAWCCMTMNNVTGSRYTSTSFSVARQVMSESFKGDNNPAKRPEVGVKISKSKTGVARIDLKGKRYFGASESAIKLGIEKMSKSKTGMKNSYPENRKSSPCSDDKSSKISNSRLKTKFKFIDMSDDDFDYWISNQKLFCKDGKRKNSNVTRVLLWRNVELQKYYKFD